MVDATMAVCAAESCLRFLSGHFLDAGVFGLG